MAADTQVRNHRVPHSIIAAIVTMTAVALGVFIALNTSIGRIHRANERLSGNVDALKKAVARALDTAEQTLKVSVRLEELKRDVEALSTETISARMDDQEVLLGRLDERMAAFKTLLTPDTIDYLVSVKVMADEVSRREQLEQSIRGDVEQLQTSTDDQISAVTSRMVAVDSDLRAIYFWILGALAAVLGAVLTAVVVVVKLAAKYLKVQPRTQISTE